MKKVLSILLALFMLLTGFAFAETEAAPFVGYSSDFTNGTDGWYARSVDGAAIEVTGDGLRITGRTASWNSPGRDFNFTPGTKYEFTVKVLQSDLPSAEFMVSMAHSKSGLESYENLAKVSAPKGAWVTLKGTFIPDAYDNYILYVETVGNGTLDFTIKDIEVEPVGIMYDPSLPSLAEVYAPYFDFGVAMNKSQVNDKQRMEFCAGQFNIMTHENELKPDSVLDMPACRKLVEEDETAVAVHFDAAKPMLDFCQANGIKVHGHVLVWHNQTPDNFFREGYSSNGAYVSREVMLGRLENYIRLVFEYTEANYPGLIVSWDVVNEAVNDTDGGLRESNWTRVVGDDFVNRAFEFARKYAPEGTLLFYNDYSTPYEPKLTGICNLLDSLIADGNIDGYGFQCHYASNTPSAAAVRTAMERISAKGLRIRVSEMDVTIKTNSDVDFAAQAEKYAEIFGVFIEYADCIDSVQVWGLTDDRSWRADQYPLLFDNKCKAKPAFHAIVELVQPQGE